MSIVADIGGGKLMSWGLPPEARRALRSELAKAVGEFTEPG